MADGDKYKITLSTKLYKVRDGGATEVEGSAMDLSWSDMDYEDVVKIQTVIPKVFEQLGGLGAEKDKEKKGKRGH